MVADAATGQDVLTRLHDDMGPKMMQPDLDALWSSLGVKMGEGGVEFDDTAPLATIRASITKTPVK